MARPVTREGENRGGAEALIARYPGVDEQRGFRLAQHARFDGAVAADRADEADLRIAQRRLGRMQRHRARERDRRADSAIGGAALHPAFVRSEEHTSELQSLMRISYAVFCLKKNTHQLLTV